MGLSIFVTFYPRTSLWAFKKIETPLCVLSNIDTPNATLHHRNIYLVSFSLSCDGDSVDMQPPRDWHIDLVHDTDVKGNKLIQRFVACEFLSLVKSLYTVIKRRKNVISKGLDKMLCKIYLSKTKHVKWQKNHAFFVCVFIKPSFLDYQV